MVGWYHGLNGHECKQTLRDGEGQGSLGPAVHGVAKRWTHLGQKSDTKSQLTTTTTI